MSRNGIQQLTAMSQGPYAQLLQVLRCQVWEDCVLDVLAERRFVLTVAQVSEPSPNTNGRALGHGS